RHASSADVGRPTAPGRQPASPTRRSSDLTAPEATTSRVTSRSCGTTRFTVRLGTGSGGASAPQPARAKARIRTPEAASKREGTRSEEHTSELQSRENLVCRLLLEKKKSTR